MCLSPFRIKPVNPISSRLVYVPCGKCKDCRNALKNSWSMRLALELETAQKNGWHVGFCTLTYDEKHLPHFSAEALDKDCPIYFSKDGSLPACFDKQQLRDFIVNIRRDLHSDYKTKGLKYMVCSEYGSHTQRPHYHCIFSWKPPELCYHKDGTTFWSGVSDGNFFELIKKYWKFGFVFPKDLAGGVDSHGYHHQPFVVNGSARFAGAYAGKYCCKDMDFVNSLKGFKFDKKSKAFKNGDCFHIQSKSLGLSWILGKSQEQLKEYLFKGIGFAGDGQLHQMPLYLRNKIFFHPLYIVERKVFDGVRLVTDKGLNERSDEYLENLGFRVDYKRLVRREASSFFIKYKKEIFQRKLEFWSSVFRGLCDEEYLKSKNFGSLNDSYFSPSNIAKVNSELCSGISFDYLASFYVSRFGVPYKYQYQCLDEDLWFFRYVIRKVPDVFSRCSLYPEGMFERLSNICSFLVGTLGLVSSEETPQEQIINYLRDKYKHME